MTYLKNFWHCLTSVGATESKLSAEDKYIRFTNVVAVLTCFAVAIYIPHSIYTGCYKLALLQTVDTFFVLSVLWFNYKMYHKTARHIYMAVINSFVIINSCYIGHESRVHDFFYITYVVPFLLFNVRDYKHIIAGVLSAIIAFNIYNHIYPFFTQHNLPMQMQLSISEINVWMKFVLFGIAIYILAYYNFYSETQLAQTNQKLIKQSEELKRSNQDLEQFAYIISHDLKAPVRNISGFMSLLLRKTKDIASEDTRELMQLSKTSAERLSKQIDDLLSYCKTGRDLPPASAIDTNRMIHTIQLELGQKIAEKNAEVRLARPLPVIANAHESMVHHVFQNLIANGIKFNTSTNPLVLIDYTEQNDTYTFAVKDNGIGLDPAFASSVFQMFKRLHSDAEFEGTGIGLAVCKKIVNFYNGDIWLESQPGKGTTFFFTLKKDEIISKPVTETGPYITQVVPILEAA